MKSDNTGKPTFDTNRKFIWSIPVASESLVSFLFNSVSHTKKERIRIDTKNVSIPRTHQHFLNLKVSANLISYGFDLVKKN